MDEQTRQIRKENPGTQRWPLWLLLADAAMYWIALYYCVLITFLYREGAISPGVRAAGMSVVLVVVFLGLSARRITGGAWLRTMALDVLFFIFIGVWAPWKFSGIGTAKGLSFLWAAIEWWKLPANLVLMFKTAPFEFILFWVILVLVIHGILRGRRLPAAFVVIAFVVFYSIKLSGIEAGVRLPAYILFDVALVVALIAGWKGRHRFFARLLIIDATFVIIFLFYLGAIPIWSGSVPGEAEGFQKIYPSAGRAAEFPLVFLRDMQADPADGFLYTAYGPTSGIVRVNIASGKADIKHNPGIVRFLWTQPGMSEVYALDWMYADFYRIRKKDFGTIEKTNLYDGLLVTPMSYVAAGGKLYVVSTDYPALTRFDLATMKKEASIDFRKTGTTIFRSGAWKCALDKNNKFIYIELGPVDMKGRYAIVRINIQKFAVDATGYLPEGGLELTFAPGGGSLLAPAFFSDRIYEIDLNNLKTKRIIRGPLTCRNIVTDEKRGLLYTTGFTKGELSVIDYRTGKTLKHCRIGKKPSSLVYEPAADTLYFGSGNGIFSVDLKKYLKN